MVQIGIPASRFKSTFGISSLYLNFAGKFGRPGLILPPAHLDAGDQRGLDEEFEIMRSMYDVILLPGGGDIRPDAYSGVPNWFQTYGNPFLDFFDANFLQRFIRAGTPIFGICRGVQALNVATGGTLKPDLWGHPTSRDRDELAHKVRAGRDTFEVNSLHHQAIDDLGGGFQVVATSEDGVVEAIVNADFPIAGVQWHPEEILDGFALELMESIVASVR